MSRFSQVAWRPKHKSSDTPHMDLSIQTIPNGRLRSSGGLDASEANDCHIYIRLSKTVWRGNAPNTRH